MRDKSLNELLKTTFGHDQFRFDQKEIIDNVLDGHDVLAVMPTGGGKSLCYQIPALFNQGITLIVSPLISLMQDQVLNLKEYGIKSCFINSSLDYEERKETEEQIKSGEIKIVYVSPEGLLTGSLASFFSDLEISLIAIDEAHCVSLWGHEFRKDYTRLGELKEVFPGVPFLGLTATADAKTRKDIAVQLKMKKPKIFVSSFDGPNINYSICERENEITQLKSFINEHHCHDTGIVYCLSRKKVEKVAADLKKAGFNAVAYHAGLSQVARSRAQKAFNREESIIVVATIAFGMGIDRPDVRFVAHLDLPKSVESYYQETGRAGRDGKESRAWMVYGLQDVMKLSQMIETTDANDQYKKVARHKLDSMLSLCETAGCRRQFLLGYFQQQSDDTCGNCDSCLNPSESFDATIDAQKIMSVIYKTGQVFGAGHVIEVLRGSENAKILERGHHELSVHGKGKDQSKHHWNSIIRQLLNRGYLAISSWEFRGLCLTEKSIDILKGNDSLKLRKQNTKTTLSKRAAKATESAHDNQDLFEGLRQLRKKLASSKNIPPYMVFGDKSLHDMCLLMPKTKSDFLLVNGVGQNKCDRYGDAFLEKISEFR